MKIMMWLIEKFGALNKVRLWVQGKKTYAVNTVQIIGGLVAMIALCGQVLDLVAKTITAVMGWGDGKATSDAMESIKNIWSNHAALALGFSAAFYSITDAASKMSSYAASQRRNIAMIAAAQAVTATAPEVKP